MVGTIESLSALLLYLQATICREVGSSLMVLGQPLHHSVAQRCLNLAVHPAQLLRKVPVLLVLLYCLTSPSTPRIPLEGASSIFGNIHQCHRGPCLSSQTGARSVNKAQLLSNTVQCLGSRVQADRWRRPKVQDHITSWRLPRLAH
jgi:hypothetical protein